MFFLEYDIFFNVFIINGINVMYIWNFLDGYKIEGISCWYKFNKMGDYIILFLVKNEVSNDIKERNIIVEESICGVILKNDGFVEKDKDFNFILSVK